MESINLITGWICILFCFIAGAIQGLFFYKENWLGGYSSWSRRMSRLGHISFFGIGLINFAYAFSVAGFENIIYSQVISYLFIIGAVTMPLVCYLSAFKMKFRHLFPIPVTSLLIGTILFISQGLLF